MVFRRSHAWRRTDRHRATMTICHDDSDGNRFSFKLLFFTFYFGENFTLATASGKPTSIDVYIAAASLFDSQFCCTRYFTSDGETISGTKQVPVLHSLVYLRTLSESFLSKERISSSSWKNSRWFGPSALTIQVCSSHPIVWRISVRIVLSLS